MTTEELDRQESAATFDPAEGEPTIVTDTESTAPAGRNDVDKSPMSFVRRAWMLWVTRGVFRTCEVFCNHAARLAERGRGLSDHKDTIAELNAKRVVLQGELNRIGGIHGHVCAECKGRCCHGPRERDAFTDRIIQDPDTDHRAARRLTGEQVAYKTMAEASRPAACTSARPDSVCCPELTVTGCRIPYDLRPIQCVAYFCGPVVKELSSAECTSGTKAVVGLMRIQLRMVGLAWRSRCARE